MAAPNGTPRPAALDEFIAELRRLRQRAGEPSFRQMAARSGAVSHATLHLTLTGRRLQPWGTVREFIRACDGDEAEWHARWERTRLALSGDADTPAGPVHGRDRPEETGSDGASEDDSRDDPAPEPIDGPAADELRSGPADHPEHGPDEGPVPGRRRWWRRRGLRVPLSAGLAVVAVAAFVWVVPGGDDLAAQGRYGGTLHAGDASEFLGDVTIPDGMVVRPDQQFVKTWKLRNSGSVHWHNRFLQRIDLPVGPNDCQTPERIPINDTAPRQEVTISVDVRAPSAAPAACKVHWKMVDESGQLLLPGYRPIYFEVRVRAE
ncbi:NBR1-Ig-like domain-containing protein [Saccharomonospora saliphila]|uniref:NBR1-Ig-like domain-containing protein n=1 Tax=Saccharomonospora saliphila TaxID=369829 RepID=UPI0003A1AFA6|nr:NBR1-Ig-like domain-containing protein [Saccharomonospora saliphila]